MKQSIETNNAPKSFLDMFATMTKDEFLEKFPTKEAQLLVVEFLTTQEKSYNIVKLIAFLQATSSYISADEETTDLVKALRALYTKKRNDVMVAAEERKKETESVNSKLTGLLWDRTDRDLYYNTKK